MRDAMIGLLPDAILARPKTPLYGYFEAAVARWRRSAPPFGVLHEELRELVDPAMVVEALKQGPVDDVVAAWRVLQLDAWLRRRAARAAPSATFARAG
jgi:hypothetical protein